MKNKALQFLFIFLIHEQPAQAHQAFHNIRHARVPRLLSQVIAEALPPKFSETTHRS